MIVMLCRCSNSTFQIDADFPGGNVIVVDIDGDSIRLQQDLRDTEGDWFYWSFRVKGAAGRTLNFEFTKGSVISSRGPAVSTDGGLTWRWLGDLGFSGTRFQYRFGPNEHEVYFGMGMNYTEIDLHRFLNQYKNHPDLKVETLCTSKKGRNVELLRIRNNGSEPGFKIFLSSRHHCGEMMATRTLEGIIETVLSDTEDGRWLRTHGDFFIVPFVDKDGVEDGDQGKNRRPHDHNRDYILRIYPEIRAMTEQVPTWLEGKPLFFLDMHCPWLRGGSDPTDPNKGTNEYPYFVCSNPATDAFHVEKKLVHFGTILETVRKGTIPYRSSFNLPYGVAWNTSSNIKTPDLQSSATWGSTLPNVIFSSSIEIPFANACGVVVDAGSARELGYDFAKAIRIYLENYSFK
jgi:hypothetical protein